MLYSPVICMLYNGKLNRWHPIIFSEYPLAGTDSSTTLIRYKSRLHHTEGFATRDAAEENARGELLESVKKYSCGPVTLLLDGDYEWNGEGVPAMVEFFGRRELVAA